MRARQPRTGPEGLAGRSFAGRRWVGRSVGSSSELSVGFSSELSVGFSSGLSVGSVKVGGMNATTFLMFVLGLGIGGALGVLWMRSREIDRQVLTDQLDARFRSAENVVAPVKESLDRFDARL